MMSLDHIDLLKKFAAPNIKTKRNEPVRMLHEELINELSSSPQNELQNEPSLSLSSRIEPQTCKNVENRLLD
jgi:hypothetical protein